MLPTLDGVGYTLLIVIALGVQYCPISLVIIGKILFLEFFHQLVVLIKCLSTIIIAAVFT